MRNALTASAVLPDHPSSAQVVDLRARLKACSVEERNAWSALQAYLEHTLHLHSDECHIDMDAHGTRLCARTPAGSSEQRLAHDAQLPSSLELLARRLWPTTTTVLSHRGWFLIQLADSEYLFQIDHLRSSGGSRYTLRRLYDTQDPLPQLDKLITLPGQAGQLRSRLDKSHGMMLLADENRINRVRSTRAIAQSMTQPERRILLSETTCHPVVAGTTQVTLPLVSQANHFEAWRQACDMSQDVIIALETDHDASRLAGLSMQGTQVVQGVAARTAGKALAQLIASGVRPEALARTLTCVVVQRQIELPCEHCKSPSCVDETLIDWVSTHSAVKADDIRHWLAERLSDNFVQTEGCAVCHDTGVGNVTTLIECIDMNEDVLDALCDGDVRYAIDCVSGLSQTAASLVQLARSGSVTVTHAMQQMALLGD